MPLKRCTLLFVEDDTLAQEQIKMILEDDVKEFYQAYDGKTGLQLYYDKKPDIIITDINLPFVNGLELAAQIKKENSSQPIIIMSANDDRDTILNSINLGNNGFIAKPVDLDLLYERLNTIAKILQKERLSRQSTKLKLKKLYNIAYYDPLTKLYSMTYLHKQVQKLLKNEKTHNFALFCIDIVNFKNINETHGYEVGDQILQDMAKKISKATPADTLIVRKSDDQFLLLLQNYNAKEELIETAQNLLEYCSQTLQINKKRLSYSSKVAIVQFPQDTKDINELFFLLNNTLENIKKASRKNYSFADENFVEIQEKNTDIITITPTLQWNKQYQQLFNKDKEIILTKKEMRLLTLLFSKTNYQATHEEITHYLWGASYLDKKENIKTLIKTLRKKLPYNFISNVFSIGYKIQFLKN